MGNRFFAAFACVFMMVSVAFSIQIADDAAALTYPSTQEVKIHPTPSGQEIALAKNPMNCENLIVGHNNAHHGSYTDYSVDGGYTWEMSTGPGTAGGDPFVTFDNLGTAYFAKLETTTGEYLPAVDVSSDSGASFSRLGTTAVIGTTAYYLNGVSGTMQLFDFDKIVGDASPTSPYRGNLYMTYMGYVTVGLSTRSEQLFQRSVDRGQTWSNPLVTSSPYPGGQFYGVQPMGIGVTSDGKVYIPFIWNTDGVFRLMKSEDGGATFTGPIAAFDIAGLGLVYGNAGTSSHSSPYMSNIAASPKDPGTIYVSFSAVKTKTGEADIYVSGSHDSGQTWSIPKMVNDDAKRGARQAYASMSVAPNGRLDVVWFDHRNTVRDPEVYADMYYAYSTDGASSFSTNIRLTPEKSPLEVRPGNDYASIVSLNHKAIAGYAKYVLSSGSYRNDAYVNHITLSAPGPVMNMCTGNTYSTIQAAIDDVQTMPGDTIRVNPGTYPSFSVTKRLTIRSATMDPATTTIDAASGEFAVLIQANFVDIGGFTLTNALYGVEIGYPNLGAVIHDNDIMNNADVGIYVYASTNVKILDNKIMSSAYGVLLSYGKGVFSEHELIQGNNIENNAYGIYCECMLQSDVTGNIFRANDFGMYLRQYCEANRIFHNDFILNTVSQAFMNPLNVRPNSWDDGLSAGNYWSDYSGTDSDGNGVGDTPYYIFSPDNVDMYPMMQPQLLQPPTASFTYETHSLYVEFDASTSTDRNGVIVSYAWNFGDGQTGSGMVTNHKYAGSGTYTVVLTVVDNEGNPDDDSQSVTVLNYIWPLTGNAKTTKGKDLTGVTITMDGTPQSTPFTTWLPGGPHTASAPPTFKPARVTYSFDHWELNGVNVGTSTSLTFILDNMSTLTAVYR